MHHPYTEIHSIDELQTLLLTHEMPIYPLLTHLASNGRYRNLLLSLTDTPDEAVRQIRAFAEEI